MRRYTYIYTRACTHTKSARPRRQQLQLGLARDRKFRDNAEGVYIVVAQGPNPRLTRNLRRSFVALPFSTSFPCQFSRPIFSILLRLARAASYGSLLACLLLSPVAEILSLLYIYVFPSLSISVSLPFFPERMWGRWCVARISDLINKCHAYNWRNIASESFLGPKSSDCSAGSYRMFYYQQNIYMGHVINVISCGRKLLGIHLCSFWLLCTYCELLFTFRYFLFKIILQGAHQGCGSWIALLLQETLPFNK